MNRRRTICSTLKNNSFAILCIIFVILNLVNIIYKDNTYSPAKNNGTNSSFDLKSKQQSEKKEQKSDNIGAKDATKSQNQTDLSQQNRPIYILWSRWRRGSSFLGKLLSYAKSNTFYSYEPLHALGANILKGEDRRTKYALSFLFSSMACRYHKYPQMLKYFIETEFYFFYNLMTKRRCKPISSCNDASILNTMCQEASLQVIKLLRLSLKYGDYLLTKNPNIKIIYLARDPRGTLKSRSRLMWCLMTPDCHDPAAVCKNLQEDLNYSENLIYKFPKRFIFVRYEDLAVNPEGVFRGIWEGLGEEYTDRIQRLIDTHTTKDLEKGTYGLKKDSKGTVFSWKSSLDYRSMTKIQEKCKEPMDALGYHQFASEKEYDSELSPLLPKWDSPFNRFSQNVTSKS